MRAAMQLSVIIPCYNEASTIEGVVGRVRAAPLPPGWSREIIIVDDGSTDGTRVALSRLGRQSEPPVILYRAQNAGKGAALKDGLARGSGDYFIVQDADDEYDPRDFSKLLEPIVQGQAVSVFGSRKRGANNVPYNAIYFYGGLLVTKIFNWLFWTNLSDIATCYKLFPKCLVPELLSSPHDDFVFDAVDLTLTLIGGGAIAEVPVRYRARTKERGKKLNWRHGLEIVIAILVARAGIALPHRRRAGKGVRFIISGGIATVVNMFALVVAAEVFGIWYLAASGLAFIIAFGVSFVLQKYWTFENTDPAKIRRQLPAHLGVALANLWINIGLMYLLVSVFGVWYLAAQLIASAMIAAETFFLLRRIFRPS